MKASAKQKRIGGLVLTSALALAVLLLFGCTQELGGQSAENDSGQQSVQNSLSNGGEANSQDRRGDDDSLENESNGNSNSIRQGESIDNSNAEYPIGWLAADYDMISAGTPVKILSLPDIEIEGHGGDAETRKAIEEKLTNAKESNPDGKPLVDYNGRVFSIEPECLLVNLPDVLPEGTYDVVYSYASTSNCVGHSLPGVTGKRLDGYAEGRQDNEFLAKREFLVPCAYETAVKVILVAASLEKKDYSLLVYDAYRPMRAQRQLSEAFLEAYESDDVIRDSIGEWSLEWYVASGPSGHNYGTDVDVGLCDSKGSVLEMPSEFDAFDERGHLVEYPMNASDISPDLYRDAVRGNEACMILHDAFIKAGFSELASEWWHFGDKETENKMRAAIGDDGLDFTAHIPNTKLPR